MHDLVVPWKKRAPKEVPSKGGGSKTTWGNLCEKVKSSIKLQNGIKQRMRLKQHVVNLKSAQYHTFSFRTLEDWGMHSYSSRGLKTVSFYCS